MSTFSVLSPRVTSMLRGSSAGTPFTRKRYDQSSGFNGPTVVDQTPAESFVIATLAPSGQLPVTRTSVASGAYSLNVTRLSARICVDGGVVCAWADAATVNDAVSARTNRFIVCM